MQACLTPAQPRSENRYLIFGQIGSGGMATVQYARLTGPAGFSRPVAIKRLHPHLANDPAFASLFLDEARLSARIVHANVVSTLDILSQPEEIAVVMEYVHGESLSELLALARKRATAVPVKVAATLLVGVLHGLHAAHETRGEDGELLGIVHRDVSPENILVGSDGVPRLLDFGIAQAKGRLRATPAGELKGKLAYMAPEQYAGEAVDRRVDIWGASVVLWECLTGQRLFVGENDAAVVSAVMTHEIEAPSRFVEGIPPELDALVLRGLSREPALRFATARDMAAALERAVSLASQAQVSDWLQGLAGERLRSRAAMLTQLQRAAEVRGASPMLGAEATRRVPAAIPGGPAIPAGASLAQAEAQGAARSASGMRLRRPAPLVLGGLLLLFLLGAAWLASTLHGPWRMSPAQAAPEPVSSPPPSARRQAPELAPSPPVPEAPAPSVEEPPEAAATNAPSAPSRARPAPARPKVTGKRRQVDCQQPFVVDALGIRRIKPECL